MDCVYRIAALRYVVGHPIADEVQVGCCERCPQAGELGQPCLNCKTQWWEEVEIDDVYGVRRVWQKATTAITQPHLEQFTDSVYKIPMTSYGRHIHPLALCEGAGMSPAMRPNMKKQQRASQPYPEHSFIFDRKKLNECVSRKTPARKHFRERMEQEMETISVLETLECRDKRLLMELKFHQRSSHSEPWKDGNGDVLGNCPLCGKYGAAGIECECSECKPVPMKLVTTTGDHINPELWFIAVTGKINVPRAEMTTGNFFNGTEPVAFDYDRFSAMVPESEARWQALDTYESDIGHCQHKMDEHPFNLEWLDDLRTKTKLEDKLVEEGHEPGYVSLVINGYD